MQTSDYLATTVAVPKTLRENYQSIVCVVEDESGICGTRVYTKGHTNNKVYLIWCPRNGYSGFAISSSVLVKILIHRLCLPVSPFARGENSQSKEKRKPREGKANESDEYIITNAQEAPACRRNLERILTSCLNFLVREFLLKHFSKPSNVHMSTFKA